MNFGKRKKSPDVEGAAACLQFQRGNSPHPKAFYPDFGPGLKVLILLVDHQQHLSDVTSLTCSVLPVASLTWQEAVGPQQQKVVIIHECVWERNKQSVSEWVPALLLWCVKKRGGGGVNAPPPASCVWFFKEPLKGHLFFSQQEL